MEIISSSTNKSLDLVMDHKLESQIAFTQMIQLRWEMVQDTLAY